MTSPRETDHTHDDAVPGTVQLVDIDGTLRTLHAKGSNSDVVLVPAPSSNPDDPLNWSPSRKLLSTTCMTIYTFCLGFCVTAIFSVLVPISQLTNLSLNNLNTGTGYAFLTFGWGCLLFQPLALQYGKRPVYLFSLLATLGVMVWAPYTTSNAQWVANKVVQGLVGAPVESLCEISVADVYFQHERGYYLAVYGLALGGSSYFAPVIGGFIAEGQGWEWVLYWCAIFCAVGFGFCFFFMEEMNFSRRIGMVGAGKEMVERDTTERKDVIQNAVQETGPSPTGSIDQAHDVTTKRTTYLDKLKPLRTKAFHKKNHMLGMAWRPLVFLTFPVIFYSGFCYGTSLVWFNVLNGTASLILSAPPYSFHPSLVGVAYVSPLLGATLAAFYTGYVGDKLILKLARRNNGILEPEYRLWLFLPCLLLVPGGLILWGVGAYHGIHWFGLIFAMGLIGFTSAVGLQVSCAYCIDSYRELAPEATVTVILVRNNMAFAMGWGITPWVQNMGLQDAFLVAAFAGLAQTAMFFVFVKYGKALRRSSAERYRRYVREMADAGVIH